MNLYLSLSLALFFIAGINNSNVSALQGSALSSPTSNGSPIHQINSPTPENYAKQLIPGHWKSFWHSHLKPDQGDYQEEIEIPQLEPNELKDLHESQSSLPPEIVDAYFNKEDIHTTEEVHWSDELQAMFNDPHAFAYVSNPKILEIQQHDETEDDFLSEL